MAHCYPDLTGEVDVVSDSEVIFIHKQILTAFCLHIPNVIMNMGILYTRERLLVIDLLLISVFYYLLLSQSLEMLSNEHQSSLCNLMHLKLGIQCVKIVYLWCRVCLTNYITYIINCFYCVVSL